MLEIFLLVHLGKRLAAKARGRGWPGWPWVILLVFGWFGGLLFGAITTHIAYVATHPGEQEAPLLLAALGAYAVATCVAIGLFTVVGFLPTDEPDDDYADEPEPPPANDPYAEYDRRYTDDHDERSRRP